MYYACNEIHMSTAHSINKLIIVEDRLFFIIQRVTAAGRTLAGTTEHRAHYKLPDCYREFLEYYIMQQDYQQERITFEQRLFARFVIQMFVDQIAMAENSII